MGVKACRCCSREFEYKSNKGLYCSPECKGKIKYQLGRVTTESQYSKVSGDWRRYLQRLLYKDGRQGLKVEDLLSLIEKQDYRCAITGEPLTCTLGRGMQFMTNASIDRIIPGGEYSLDNIQLVCRIVNVMKWNMEVPELRFWCERILSGTEKQKS